TVTTRYRDDGMKAWHFVELAYLLPPRPLLNFATTISEEHRSRLIVALAPHLSAEELLGEAVDAAFVIHDPLHRANTLTALAGKLSGDRRREVIHGMLECIPNVSRSKVLA